MDLAYSLKAASIYAKLIAFLIASSIGFAYLACRLFLVGAFYLSYR